MTAPTVYGAGPKPITGALAGTELVEVNNGHAPVTTVTTRQIAELATTADDAVVTALNTVGAGTITAAGIVGQNTSRGGAQSGAAFTDTTATAALIIAALPAGVATGTSLVWTYRNTTNAQATLAGGSGVTLSGMTIVPANTWVSYLVTYVAAGDVTIAAIASGTNIPLNAAQYATEALESAAITNTSVAGANVCHFINTGTTPGNLQFPTAADLVAAIPNAAAGFKYTLLIRNGSGGANTATITTNTGITLTGTMTIAQNVTRTFVVTLTSLTAVTVQSMGISAAGA